MSAPAVRQAARCGTCRATNAQTTCVECMVLRREEARAFHAALPPADRANARLTASWCKHLYLVAGVSYEDQATAAGITVEQLMRAINHPCATIESKHALALLDYDLPATRVRRANLCVGEPVPATATRRRIQGMMAQGFSRMAITSRLGMSRAQTLSDWARFKTVPSAAAEAIEKLATVLHGQDGGNRNGQVQSARQGYLPLSAWDGVDITDPDVEPSDSRTWLEIQGLPTPEPRRTPRPPAKPGSTWLCLVDPVVIYRTLMGNPPGTITRAERLLVVQEGSRPWPAGPELSSHELAERLGTYPRDINRIRANLALMGDVLDGLEPCRQQLRPYAILLGALPAPYGRGMSDTELAEMLGMRLNALIRRRREVLIDARQLINVTTGVTEGWVEEKLADDGFDVTAVRKRVRAGVAPRTWVMGAMPRRRPAPASAGARRRKQRPAQAGATTTVAALDVAA